MINDIVSRLTEVPPAGVVQGVVDVPDAVGEVAGDGDAGVALHVGQEAVAAEVVAADPQGVDGVVLRQARRPVGAAVAAAERVSPARERVGGPRRRGGVRPRRQIGDERGHLVLGH